MNLGTLYDVSEATRRVGKGSNRKLIRALIRHHDCDRYETTSGTMLTEAGLEQLTEAVKAWDGRPRIYRELATA